MMSTVLEDQIEQVMFAVDVLSNISAQDRTMVLEMSQTMLRDIIENRRLAPMNEYSHFIDCTDTADETDQLIIQMTQILPHDEGTNYCVHAPAHAHNLDGSISR
jgi:hypothetical protein